MNKDYGYNQYGQNQTQENPANLGPTNSPQPLYTYSPQNSGWQFYGGAWHPVLAENTHKIQNNSPEKAKNKAALKVCALIMACFIAGFGGAYGANTLWDGRKTVVYRAASPKENAQTNVDGNEITQVAAAAGQSVVSIEAESVITEAFAKGRTVSGAGSGVIISEDGYIVTNNHVVEGAKNVNVTLQDGTELLADVVGGDVSTDIALLKADVTGLVPAVMGNSDNLLVGQFCIAIGNPMGILGGTVTDGIISALNREITIDNQTMSLLQMSAAVSPGNSGGGLFNTKGELVGIVNAKSGGSNTEGLGFAIPVNTAVQVAQQLIEHGYVTGRPALGISVLDVLSKQEAKEMGYEDIGVYVASVNPNSPAEKAGIKPGDCIVKVEGQEVLRSADVGNAIKQKAVGDEIFLEIMREGEKLEITAILGEMKPVA